MCALGPAETLPACVCRLLCRLQPEACQTALPRLIIGLMQVHDFCAARPLLSSALSRLPWIAAAHPTADTSVPSSDSILCPAHRSCTRSS